MPELPEVETARRGIEPHLRAQKITALIVRERRLRWPVPDGLEQKVAGKKIVAVKRRAKYILIELDSGRLILHLGMSGSVRIVQAATPNAPAPNALEHAPASNDPEHAPEAAAKHNPKHDHFDLVLQSGTRLRYNDPRRFGCLLWCDKASEHRLLSHLGPEPLGAAFTASGLKSAAKNRKVAVKQLIMQQQIVVGVGNIYASEALHHAGISPLCSAKNIQLPRLELLVRAIKQILNQAIKAGGTTLKDFTNSEGKPGYFKQALAVYGRAGQACLRCHTGEIKKITQGGRATYYCPACQK